MASDADTPDRDPRAPAVEMAAASARAAALRPAVAGPRGGAPWLVIGGAGVVGVAVFLWLSSHRATPPATPPTPAAALDATATPTPMAAPSADIVAAEAAARGLATAPPPVVAQAPAVALVTPPPIRPLFATPAAPPASDGPARRQAPALVVDFGQADAAPKPAATAASGRAPTLNGDEQFAARVEAAEPERSRAVMLTSRASIVPQGAMIPAVLETALDSDLPGFTRAVVSRDVRSFDGSTVLIPRGSRVIGQYKSAALQGQSRAFVIWTRVLRPDGASIQIGSSGADELGRAGLAGAVDRHFFERFSGAILLSVVNAGAASLAGNNGTQVVIGSSSDASSLAATASAFAPAAIPPTIKVAQGSPIRIFVARDLDFTPVQGAGR